MNNKLLIIGGIANLIASLIVVFFFIKYLTKGEIKLV